MCDTLCALLATGALFAKNSDRPVGEPQVFERFAARPAGGELRTQYLTIPDRGAHALAGSRPTWLWGLEHGVNEHRVAIGNEKVWTVEDPRGAPDALVGMDLVRLGLELGHSAESAVDAMTDLLERYGQGGICEASTGARYFSSFLVADPSEAWVIETSGRHWEARRAETGGVAISNRITMRDDWRRPASPTAHADKRLSRTCAAASASDASPIGFVRVLRDHDATPGELGPVPPPGYGPDGRGVSICMHVRDDQSTTGSMVASLPADLDEPVRLFVALGSPCVSVYVPLVGLDHAPALLGEAHTWMRFDRLRLRAETDPDALAAIRAVLDPVERDLWDGASAGTRIEDALRQLGV